MSDLSNTRRNHYRYDVDMEVGICSCVSGWTGKLCKHQVAAAEATLSSAPQLYIPSPENKKLLVETALGEGRVPEGFFQDFMQVDGPCFTESSAKSVTEITDLPSTSTSVHESQPQEMSDDDDFELPQPSSHQSSTAIDEEFLAKWNDAWQNAAQNFATSWSKEGMQKVMDRLCKIKTSIMFDSFLHSWGSGLGLTKGRKSQIKVQPTSISRRRPGLSRGASTVGKGRPALNASEKKGLKRKRNLALNVALNQPNAKSHWLNCMEPSMRSVSCRYFVRLLLQGRLRNSLRGRTDGWQELRKSCHTELGHIDPPFSMSIGAILYSLVRLFSSS